MTESVTAKARERQFRDHLDQYLVDDASISRLGPAKKAALRTFGIETAADVTASSVGSVKGFGTKLTSAMMTWKSEARFRFGASHQALQADIMRVRNEIAVQRQTVEATLQGGVERLARMEAESEALATRPLPGLATAANELRRRRPIWACDRQVSTSGRMQWDGRPHPTTASMCQSGSVGNHSKRKERPPCR